MMHPSRQAYVEETEEPEKAGRAARRAKSRAAQDSRGIDLANLPIDRDYELPATQTGVPQEKASAILQQFERKRRAKTIAVPTEDGRVRARLREFGEPQTLFGEGPADRRDRLREILTDQEDAGGDVDTPMQDAEAQDEDEADEEFYIEGSDELEEARKSIALYSLPRARDRVQQQKVEATIPLKAHMKHRKAIKEKLSGFELYASQQASDRPIGIARFSPSGDRIAAGHFGGGIKMLSLPNLEETTTLRGHNGRVGGISWFPNATKPSGNVSSATVNLASSGGEGDHEIHIWSLDEDTPISTLSGHTGRVCRIEFHPSGRYLASASYDMTWRLWDVTTTVELLLQEGHSKEVYTVAFNGDGSLIASAGLDSIGRVWDLRTGRTVMILDGHIKDVTSLDWSPDSFRVLSGSTDGFVKCWDVRNVREQASVGAHKGGVTDLRWFKCGDTATRADVTTSKGNGANGAPIDDHTTIGTKDKSELIPKKSGTFTVSSGFDKKVNIFSADDWSLCKSLEGHSSNVLSTDVTEDARWILSSGYDRTVKLWARDNGEGI
ncbi:MAG: hypothetical protein M1820_003480 [Bogoriella megaspora]|nr:MAG: hypothetical protein M1820_003480 [Bogoriella megaspora]